MQIKKTVGLPYKDGERKGYTIHTECGEAFIAAPLGATGWQCGGKKFKTLNAVKHDIRHGAICEDNRTEPIEASTANGADTWDCVHPCALLIVKLDTLASYPHLRVTEEELTTLDSYGWLDVMGRPDIARAEREIKRVQNLNKGN